MTKPKAKKTVTKDTVELLALIALKYSEISEGRCRELVTGDVREKLMRRVGATMWDDGPHCCRCEKIITEVEDGDVHRTDF